MGPWCSAEGLFFTISYCFELVKLLLLSGRGTFSSPGLNTHRRSYLKLQRQSWRWNKASLAITLAADFWSCGLTTSPGYCTCRRPLCWRAVKAGECAYWPGNFRIFYHVTDRGIVQMWVLLFCMGKWQIVTFRIEKWQIVTFSYRHTLSENTAPCETDRLRKHPLVAHTV